MADLLICVEGSASDDDERACRECFEALHQRQWTYPPAFVEQLDEIAVTAAGDLPVVRTVGVVVALPDPAEDVDEEAVRADVTALVAAVSTLARQAMIEFVVEYREETIGFLDGGPRDARVVASFLGTPTRLARRPW